MDMRLKSDDQAFQQEVRDFIDNNWPITYRKKIPSTPSHAAKEPETRHWYDALDRKGWAVPDWPEEHGGTSWTPTQKYIWNRETVKAYCPERSPFGASMLAPVLYTWGSESQQKKFLPPIRKETVQWCQGYSEPNAGSDLANLRTKAVLVNDHYVVNGTKLWTSSAHFADWMFCLVRTNTNTDRPQKGISFLLIDMNSPGIEVNPVLILGGLHTVNSVTLNDVNVPRQNLIGKEDEGWTYAKGLLTHERTGIANVAGSQRELRHLRQYAHDAQADGTDLLNQQSFMRKINEIDIELRALEGIELRSLVAMESGGEPGPESSLLKIRGTEIAQRISDLQTEALGYYAAPYPDQQLIDNEGPVGFDYAVPVLQDMLYGRAASIFGGSNEIQKNIIAKTVLELS